MATFTNNFYGGGKGYSLCLDVTTNSQSVANNTSNVTVKVRLVSLGSSYTIKSSTSKNGSVTIDGTKYTFTFTAGLTGNQNKTLFTKTLDIAHSSDGSKTLSVSTTCYLGVTLSGRFYGNTTVSGSTALTAIPRSTPVTVSGSGTFGDSKWIGHTRASSAFTVTLRYICGSASGIIANKTSTNETYWTPPKTLQSEIPKATSIPITIYCDTYNGSTLIGTTSVTFTCNVASDCIPTINNGVFICPETGNTTYYQTASRLLASIHCNGAYGSIITKYVMTVDGQTITNYSSTIRTGYLTGSGYKDISVTITDSRGKTASRTWTKAIFITSYSKPVISLFTCKRMGYEDDSDELVISNLGTHGYVTYNCSFNKNATNTSIELRYKASGTDTWSSVTMTSTEESDYLFSSNLATGSAYDIKLILTDNISSVERSIVMQNIYPLINLSADGTAIAFGKECNVSNKFMVMMDASFNKHTQIWSSEFGYIANFNSNIDIKNKLAFNSDDENLFINDDNEFSRIVIKGNTVLRDRGDYHSILDILTSGDGSNNETMLGYYDPLYSGYSHYFRGRGAVVIDNTNGLVVNGAKVAGGSNATVSLFYGDMTSGSVTLTDGAKYKALVIGAMIPNSPDAGITPLYVPNILFNTTTGIDIMIGTASSYTSVNIKLQSANSKNVIMTYKKGGRIKYVTGCI